MIGPQSRTQFAHSPYVECAKGFTNQLTDPVNSFFYGGWGHICVPEQLSAVFELIGPMRDSNPRFENFPVSANRTVVRYAGKDDDTKLHILFDLPYL